MDFIGQYNLTGIVIAFATFLVIGLFHPIVIKAEYHFGVRCWWGFMIMGVISLVCSLLVKQLLCSVLLGVWSASSFWSIGELFHQRRRVEKGWFPRNPKRMQ